MEHYAGIDVSLERSSVCVVDSSGRIIREIKVASEPEALVGLFAGPISCSPPSLGSAFVSRRWAEAEPGSSRVRLTPNG